MHPSSTRATSASHTIEGIARVVQVDGATVWLEPEQTTSCGSCASSAACGSNATGIGTVATRMQARRFLLNNTADFHVGERLVVGVNDQALIKGALIAYGLPLITALTAGALSQNAWGDDLMTMAGMAAGLFAGLAAARLGARSLADQGSLTPRYLRRARPDETCTTV